MTSETPDTRRNPALRAVFERLGTPVETPDTPSTEARHDPFCVMFGINDLMQGRESDCTCAARRSDTPSTEALTPERLAEALERWYPNSPNPSSAVAAAIIAGLDAERAVRQEAADTSGRGTIRIRTPDDKPGTWTAWSDLVPGMPYTYSSGDVAVTVDWKAADTSGHPDDDFVARAQRYRAEHDASHEDEMCGGPCIVLGLTEEAADISGLRAAAQTLVRLWFDLAGPEGMSATYAALVAGHNETFSEAMWSLRAALEGATERPLDVCPACRHPVEHHLAEVGCYCRCLASPTTTTPETEG